MRIHSCFGAALVILAAAGAPLAAQTDTVMRRVHLLEGRGQIDSAILVLSAASSRDSAWNKARRDTLQAISRALASSRFYADQGDLELAIDALEGLPLTRSLRRFVEAERTRLERHPARQARQRGMAEVVEAEQRVRAGHVELARDALEAIVRDSTGRYPLAVRDSAMRSLRWARQEVIRLDSGFVATFKRDGVRTAKSLSALVIYVVALAILALVVYALWIVLGTRKGIGLELEDLSAPSGEPRLDANRLLVKDISRMLRTAAHSTGTSLGERPEDLDGVANLRASSPVQDALDRLVQSGTLQIGTLSIDPKQFISLFVTLAQRPYRTTLRGHLSPSADGRMMLFVERFDRRLMHGFRFRPVRSARFYARPGAVENARESALQAFVTDCLFDLSPDRPTEVLESFRAYCDALRLLADPACTDAQARMERACRSLERAVCVDPRNWAARVKLAEVLRKQGRYTSAADHLEFVLADLARPSCDQPPQLRAYLARRPELRLVLRYSQAVTHSLGFDEASHDRALGLLDGILAELRIPPAGEMPAGAPRTDTPDPQAPEPGEGAAKAPEANPSESGASESTATEQKGPAIALRTAASRAGAAAQVVGSGAWIMARSMAIPVGEIFPSRVPPAERFRIGMLALSARASTLAAKMEAIREREGAAAMPTLRRLRADIEAILARMRQDAPNSPDPSARQTALGVVLNAAGRAAHLTCDLDCAVAHLQRAIDQIPDMPDPHVNLAAALIRRANGGPLPRRVYDSLARALRINEDNEKAHYYLGRLAQLNGDPGAADEHFSRAGDHHWALYLHARVVALDREARDVGLALAKLEQSIESYRRADERYTLYLRLCEERAKNGTLAPGTRRWIASLVRELEASPDPTLRAEGTHYRQSLEVKEKDGGGDSEDVF